jgi:hypothetical protein
MRELNRTYVWWEGDVDKWTSLLPAPAGQDADFCQGWNVAVKRYFERDVPGKAAENRTAHVN